MHQMLKKTRRIIGRTKEDNTQWCVAIVGMNGVGKTRLGKRLASKLHLKRLDSDALFLKRHGDPKQYIKEHGWEAFRKLEEVIILNALKPGHLVVLSGGAIESETVRNSLKQNAAVLWIHAHPKRVTKQIREAKKERPEFAGGAVEHVAKKLVGERDHLYQEVANITIHKNIPFNQFVPISIAELRKHFRTTADGTD
tara:strand:- start:1542 stop:2132 length:591 start_codon:yes stop_codon:yes gene_type:complete